MLIASHGTILGILFYFGVSTYVRNQCVLNFAAILELPEDAFKHPSAQTACRSIKTEFLITGVFKNLSR